MASLHFEIAPRAVVCDRRCEFQYGDWMKSVFKAASQSFPIMPEAIARLDLSVLWVRTTVVVSEVQSIGVALGLVRRRFERRRTRKPRG